MIRLLLKGECARLSAHFTSDEFDCQCNREECTHTTIDMALIDALEAFRSLVGKPVAVRSGYRCPAHNAEVGGARDGAHPRGTAADVIVVGFTAVELKEKAQEVDRFRRGGIGIYKRYPRMVHLDVRLNGPARWTK